MAKIRVTNTGNQEEAYMVDARRNDQTVLPLTSIGGNPASEPLPISDGSTIPQFVVPPFSTTATIGASSTVPITLDTSPNFGTPDVEAQQFGNSAVATRDRAGAAGLGVVLRAGGAGSVQRYRTVDHVQLWCGRRRRTSSRPTCRHPPETSGRTSCMGTNTYNPLVLDPARRARSRYRSVRPTRTSTTVRGFLTLETFNFNTLSSDEVATFPYAYRVGF